MLAGYHHSGDRGLGRLAQEFPGTGQHGPSLPFPGLVFPADTGKEIIARVVTVPPLLTLFAVDELGRVDAEGPDGVHVGQAEGFADGVSYGAYPFYVAIGIGTLTGSITTDSAAPSGVLSSAPAPQPGQLTGGVTTDEATPTGLITGTVPPAPTPFVPRRNVTLLYSVLDPTATPDLTAKDPGETVRLVADFTPFTPQASPAPVWVVTRVGGDDGTASPAIVGNSAINGNQVQQLISGGTDGNSYSVRCEARGPNGEQLVAAGRLPVRAR